MSQLNYQGRDPTLGPPSNRRKSNRPRCAQCGTRRFRRDADTGQLICREGHVLQGYREEEAQDDGEFVQTQSQRRYVRADPNSLSARRRRQKKTLEARQVWGATDAGKARAAFQCYECLQLILRLQLKALRLEWPDLPPEIEAIARDLWTMFVSMNTKLHPAPHTENLEFVKEQLQTARDESEARSERRSRSRSRARMEQEEIDRLRRQDSAPGGDEDEEMAESQRQRKIDRDVRRAQGIASSDEEGNASDDEDGDDARRAEGSSAQASSASIPALTHERMRKACSDPMNALICIIYLSLISARVPILWGDLHRLLASNRIPYLGATKIIPEMMVAKLPENELRKLEMDSVPSIVSLQERTSRLADDLTARFPSAGIPFPELNAAPILWRLVQDMGLPPTLYDPARALLTYLGIPLAVVPDASVGDVWSLLGVSEGDLPEEDEHEQQRPAIPPIEGRLRNTFSAPHATRCCVLMAALVVIVKMRYGLDGRLRHEELDAEAGSLELPPLDLYLEALTANQRALKADAHFVHELQTHPSSLSNEQIDSLLDYSEQVYFDKGQPNLRWQHRKGDLAASDLFPNLPGPQAHRSVRPYNTPADDAATAHTSMRDVWARHRQNLHDMLYPLKVQEHGTNTPKHSLRPGDAHAIHNTADGSTDVHPSYRRVLMYAAGVVGLSPCGSVDCEEERNTGWREMGQIVADMERLLARRMRREADAKRRGKI